MFYSVRVEPGQKLRATLITPAPGTKAPLRGASTVDPSLRIFTPLRTMLASRDGVVQADSPASITAVSPQIRVRNRESEALPEGLSTASVAGHYFLAVTLKPWRSDVAGRVIKVQLNIAVDGKPSGLPHYATATPSPEPSAVSPSASVSTSASAPRATTDPPVVAPDQEQSPSRPVWPFLLSVPRPWQPSQQSSCSAAADPMVEGSSAPPSDRIGNSDATRQLNVAH